MSPTLPDSRVLLDTLFATAVRRAQPLHGMGPLLPPPPQGRTIVVGAGKAGGAMADALDQLWPQDAPLEGLVITRYHHVPPSYGVRQQAGRARIEVVEAAHPVPDAAGLAATERLLQRVQGLGKDDLVIALVSGGGSALLTLPAPGLSLADKQAINQALLLSGAAIDEMNCVRKHLSGIKGGRLAAACAPARLVTLLISDVPGDEPAVIASGPTVPDGSTCADALAICQRYGITLPPAALDGLRRGVFETPKPGDPCFAGQTVHLLATPRQALEAAAEQARSLGLNAYVLSDDIEGESREIGKMHAALARAAARGQGPFQKPCVILSGGETTVTVKGPAGRGGRAGEFSLACAVALQGLPGVWALAADTDGIDGVEDNAGAFVAPDTLARGLALGRKAQEALDGHDVYPFFQALGDLVTTGPTYTNVNDFRALLVL